MNITYSADTKYAVDKISGEFDKIEVARIFYSICSFESSMIDSRLYLAAMECTEAFATHMVKNLGFSHRETNYCAV